MANVTEGIVEISATPAIFAKPDEINEIISKIKIAVSEAPKDASTPKSRKVIASYANKIARSKVFLDGLGKDYVSDLKKQAGQVDAIRRELRTKLDGLKETVRKPLTEWEQAIKDRIAEFDSVDLSECSIEEIERHIEKIESVEIDDSFDRFKKQAELAKTAALSVARAALIEKKKRKEAEEREIAEREERRKREIAEAEARAKREAEAKAKEAEDARKFAEARAKALQEKVEAEKRKAELIKRKFEEAQKKQKQTDAKQADAKKPLDKEAIAKVNREALKGFIDLGVEGKLAKTIVIAIVKGKVPHVKIDYEEDL